MIVVSVLILVLLVALPWACFDVLRRMARVELEPDRSPTISYGALPALGPVGRLGEQSPDADPDEPSV